LSDKKLKKGDRFFGDISGRYVINAMRDHGDRSYRVVGMACENNCVVVRDTISKRMYHVKATDLCWLKSEKFWTFRWGEEPPPAYQSIPG